jgi:hypothetical protein
MVAASMQCQRYIYIYYIIKKYAISPDLYIYIQKYAISPDLYIYIQKYAISPDLYICVSKRRTISVLPFFEAMCNAVWPLWNKIMFFLSQNFKCKNWTENRDSFFLSIIFDDWKLCNKIQVSLCKQNGYKVKPHVHRH